MEKGDNGFSVCSGAESAGRMQFSTEKKKTQRLQRKLRKKKRKHPPQIIRQIPMEKL